MSVDETFGVAMSRLLTVVDVAFAMRRHSGRRETRTRHDDEVCELEQPGIIVPRVDFGKRISTHDEVELAGANPSP
jgi:hypothetical protein